MNSSAVTFMRFAILVVFFSMVKAGPRYIAIPIDNVDVIELNPVTSPPAPIMARTARHADTVYVQQQPLQPHVHESSIAALESLQQQPSARVDRATAAHILDYVDFGAHTGPNGAFSWYADYPSHH